MKNFVIVAMAVMQFGLTPFVFAEELRPQVLSSFLFGVGSTVKTNFWGHLSLNYIDNQAVLNQLATEWTQSKNLAARYLQRWQLEPEPQLDFSYKDIDQGTMNNLVQSEKRIKIRALENATEFLLEDFTGKLYPYVTGTITVDLVAYADMGSQMRYMKQNVSDNSLSPLTVFDRLDATSSLAGWLVLDVPQLADLASRTGDPLGTWLATVGHEVGHYLSKLNRVNWSPYNIREDELRADCIGGAFIAFVYKKMDPSSKVFKTANSTGTAVGHPSSTAHEHPSATGRGKSFSLGAMAWRTFRDSSLKSVNAAETFIRACYWVASSIEKEEAAATAARVRNR